MATAVVIATVLVVVALVVLFVRQGSVGRLSEEDGRPAHDPVVERPAGPGAEPMHPNPPNRFPGDVDDRPGDEG